MNKIVSYLGDSRLVLAFALILSFALHSPILNDEIRGMHTWRQSQTMWNIRNFCRHDANILNPRVGYLNSGPERIVRYEFPIMQWVLGMGQRLLGEHIAVVRVGVFLFTALGVLGFFKWLLVLGLGKQTATLGAIFFLFSPVLHLYAASPLPDILALAASVWYLYGTMAYWRHGRFSMLVLSALALCIATCAKLPFLMFSVVSIYLFFESLLTQRRITERGWRLAVVQLVAVAPAIAWYVWVMPGWTGNPILKGIFSGDSPHGRSEDILGYYFSTTLPLHVLNPALVIPFLAGFFYLRPLLPSRGWLYALLFITCLYIILQHNALGTFHDYYFLPFLPWAYTLVAVGCQGIGQHLKPRWRTLAALLLVVGVPISSHLLASPKWGLKYSGYFPELYLHQAALRDCVPPDSRCIIINDNSMVEVGYLMDKMGHVFYNDHLPVKWIADLSRHHGVHYMYSNSRVVDEAPDVQPHLDSLLLERGSWRVYKLK